MKNIVITILAVLVIAFGGYFIYDKFMVKESKTQNKENNLTNIEEKEIKKDYTSFIGEWSGPETNDIVTIKNVTNNSLTFTWFIYRLGGIDDNTTLSFEDGKSTFCYEGSYDSNFDGKITDDEKYKRKSTLALGNGGVTITVEDVKSFDENCKVLTNFSGAAYINVGVYKHPEKNKEEELIDNSINLDFDFNELSNTLHSKVQNGGLTTFISECEEINDNSGDPKSKITNIEVSEDTIDIIIKKLKSAQSIDKNITYGKVSCHPKSFTYYVSVGGANMSEVNKNKVFTLEHIDNSDSLIVGYNGIGYSFKFKYSEELDNFVENLK